MKKVLSVVLVLCVFLSLSVHSLAAEVQKVIVTAEKTTIFNTASMQADSLGTVKEGSRFIKVGSTKSFWKIEFKRKNDDTVYTGYLLKTETADLAVETTKPVASTAKPATSTAKPAASTAKPSASAGNSNTNTFNTYSQTQAPTSAEYVGNSNTMKFHEPSCSQVKKIKPANLESLSGKNEARDRGYVACKVCNP